MDRTPESADYDPEFNIYDAVDFTEEPQIADEDELYMNEVVTHVKAEAPATASSSVAKSAESAKASQPAPDSSHYQGDGYGTEGMTFVNVLQLANLQWWISDKRLESIVADIGKVYRLKFLEDKVNGKSRGICYIQLEDPEKTSQAIEKLSGMALDGKTVEASLSSSQVFEQLSTHNRGRKERRELFGGTSTWTGPPAGGRGMGQPSHSQPQGAPAPFKQQSRGPPRDGGFPQGGRDFQGDRGDRVGMGGFNRGPPKSGGGFYGRGGGGVPISFPGDFGYGGGPGMFPGSYPVGMMPHINPAFMGGYGQEDFWGGMGVGMGVGDGRDRRGGGMGGLGGEKDRGRGGDRSDRGGDRRSRDRGGSDRGSERDDRTSDRDKGTKSSSSSYRDDKDRSIGSSSSHRDDKDRPSGSTSHRDDKSSSSHRDDRDRDRPLGSSSHRSDDRDKSRSDTKVSSSSHRNDKDRPSGSNSRRDDKDRPSGSSSHRDDKDRPSGSSSSHRSSRDAPKKDRGVKRERESRTDKDRDSHRSSGGVSGSSSSSSSKRTKTEDKPTSASSSSHRR